MSCATLGLGICRRWLDEGSYALLASVGRFAQRHFNFADSCLPAVPDCEVSAWLFPVVASWQGIRER
jgi:hypothetical protein